MSCGLRRISNSQRHSPFWQNWARLENNQHRLTVLFFTVLTERFMARDNKLINHKHDGQSWCSRPTSGRGANTNVCPGATKPRATTDWSSVSYQKWTSRLPWMPPSRQRRLSAVLRICDNEYYVQVFQSVDQIPLQSARIFILLICVTFLYPTGVVKYLRYLWLLLDIVFIAYWCISAYSLCFLCSLSVWRYFWDFVIVWLFCYFKFCFH